MKRILISLGVMMAATLSLTNCTKEIQQPVQEAEKVPYTIYATSAETKTVNDGTNNGLTTKWAAGDQLNVFHAEAGTTEYSGSSTFTVAAADVETGRFTTDALNGTIAASNDWYAFYPYSDYRTSPIKKGYTPIGSYVGGTDEPKVQTQIGNDNMAHIAGDRYPMWGIAPEVSEEDKPNIRMTHLSSLLEVVVTNSTTDPLAVTSISFTATEDIVGTYYIDFSSENPVFEKSGASYASKTANLVVSEGEPIEAGASASFYLAVKPFTAASGSDLVLSVNGVSKSNSLKSDVTFSSGKIKKLNYEFKGAVTNSHPFTSNMILTKGTNASDVNPTINGSTPAVTKLGTGSAAGDISLVIPAGTTKIGFYALSWKDKEATLALKLGSTVVGTVTPPAHTGVSSSVDGVINVDDNTCYYEIEVNAAETAVYQLTTADSENKRVIVWGINYYTSEGLGANQESFVQTALAAPVINTPTESNVSGNVVTLTWPAVANAASYEVYVGETVKSATFVTESGVITATISGLAWDSTYSIAVVAKADSNSLLYTDSPKSSAVSVTIGTNPNPDQPETTLPIGTVLYSETFGGEASGWSVYNMSGSTTYDDASTLVLTSSSDDNVKMDGNSAANMTDKYNLYLKGKNSAWAQVAGIKSYGAKSVTVTWAANNANSRISIVESSTSEVTSEKSPNNSATFTLSGTEETITLKISNPTSSNTRVDDVKIIIASN